MKTFAIHLLGAGAALISACANSGASHGNAGTGDGGGATLDAGPDNGSASDSAVADVGVKDQGDAASRDAGFQGQGDATANDAAVQDGGSTSDGGIGGVNAAIHDDFESGMLSKWTLTDPFGNALPPNESVAIDTASTGHVHSGTYSVKVHNGGLIGAAPPSSSFYGRFWVWLGSNPSPGRSSGGHWAWAVAPGTLPAGTVSEVRQGGQFDILIDNYSLNDDIVLSDPNVFTDTDGGVTPAVGQWLCVEFFYGKDSLRTWLQGTEVATLDVAPTTVWAHGMTAPWSPAYSAIRVGYAGYNGNLIDLWIDDVAIDKNRIGCD